MKKEIVVTGIGVLSPAGIEREEFWTSLYEGKSGIGPLSSIETVLDPKPIGGEVPEFNPKNYVKPKKNIKVMSRDIQMAFVSVMHACEQAGLVTEGDNRSVDPERLGVIFGCDLIGTDLKEMQDAFIPGFQSNGSYDFSTWGEASMEKIMPLWMLKYLPNMPACHIGIALDARGPNNTQTLERESCISAMAEAVRIIENGDADIMICGSCGNKINPVVLARAKAYNANPFDPDSINNPRPFDADRAFEVLGEGSASFVLESKEFALARGAKPLANILSITRTMTPVRGQGAQKDSLVRAMSQALQEANRTVGDLDHLNADGLGSVDNDPIEASAIREVLGDVPVFSAKGHIGMLGSGAGSVELAASLMSMKKGFVPATKNCEKIAGDCPINVICKAPKKVEKQAFMKINYTNLGRACAVMMENC